MVDPAVRAEIETLFPGLRRTRFELTSPEDRRYNCIAWAAVDTGRFWWPRPETHYYWPPDVPREATIEAFVAAYGTLGFEVCADREPEAGFEKIAIYVDPAGKPKHAARQLLNGRWTSKLGNSFDIEHELKALEGRRYGKVKVFLKRPTRRR